MTDDNSLPVVAQQIDDLPERFLPMQIIGLPSERELATISRVAQQIAYTDFVPKAYRGKPEAILACVLTGRELRIPFMQSLRDIDVVEGSPAPSAKLLRELILRKGHQLRLLTSRDDKTKATYRYRRADWPPDEWGEASFTIEMAESAGLVKIVNGKVQARSSGGKTLPWESYTSMMLTHRCIAMIARDVFADCIGTMLYTAEELGANVDADGRVIDIEASHEMSELESKWEEGLSALPEKTRTWAIEQLGSPFYSLPEKNQQEWVNWLQTVMEKVNPTREITSEASNVAHQAAETTKSATPVVITPRAPVPTTPTINAPFLAISDETLKLIYDRVAARHEKDQEWDFETWLHGITGKRDPSDLDQREGERILSQLSTEGNVVTPPGPEWIHIQNFKTLSHKLSSERQKKLKAWMTGEFKQDDFSKLSHSDAMKVLDFLREAVAIPQPQR